MGEITWLTLALYRWGLMDPRRVCIVLRMHEFVYGKSIVEHLLLESW